MKGFDPGPLPVPNFGYACLNMSLRNLKPPIFTSRDLIRRTLDTKGPEYLGELALANCRDLARLIQWNHEHGIRFFRVSSVIWPWMGTYDVTTLPQYQEISKTLRFAGDLSRLYGQRITFHPSHFVKLGGEEPGLTAKSSSELEAHSQVFDLMGFEPSPWNKINIHVGGVYGDKELTMGRWAAAYLQLSDRCRARVTVENDDRPNAFSVRDLLFLNKLCGVPIVFDFHHWKFCQGDMTQEEAFKAAIATWPAGVRPVAHWSESQAGRPDFAHSDYVRGPFNMYGLEKDVDLMIEAKCKELALLCARGDIPFPDPGPVPEEAPKSSKKQKQAAAFLED